MTNPIMLEGPAHSGIIQPSRIGEQHMADIKIRLQRGLNPESAVILYPQDVAALLGEIMALEQGVWQKDEMLRLRDLAARARADSVSQQAEMQRLQHETLSATAAQADLQADQDERFARQQTTVVRLEAQIMGLREELLNARSRHIDLQAGLRRPTSAMQAALDELVQQVDA